MKTREQLLAERQQAVGRARVSAGVVEHLTRLVEEQKANMGMTGVSYAERAGAVAMAAELLEHAVSVNRVAFEEQRAAVAAAA